MKLPKFLNSGNLVTVFIVIGIILSSYILISRSSNNDRTKDGRVIINYWEKWNGFELEAMQTIVDDFNASQDKVFVKLLTVSEIRRKLMLATSGGNPPDIAGVWSHTINTFSVKGALTPLNKLIEEYGINKEDYIPVVWDMANNLGFTWIIPIAVQDLALHWNKDIFIKAGLNPEKPPQNMKEFSEYCDILTVVKIKRNGKYEKLSYVKLTEKEKADKDFDIVQLGFTPSVPGWWNPYWGFWFYASLWDDKDKATANSKENIEALDWFAGFTKKYGIKNLQRYCGSLGNFASPQGPFVSGSVAMILQGVWMSNFIEKFNPSMAWGATAFPAVKNIKDKPVTLIEFNGIVIPSGARHPREAFEFLKYISRQDVSEKFNSLMNSIPPFKTVSKDFYSKHPNPYIKEYVDLAGSPNAKYEPNIPILEEYKDEMNVAYDQAFNGEYTAQEALNKVQNRVQPKLEKYLENWIKVKDSRIDEWRKENDSL